MPYHVGFRDFLQLATRREEGDEIVHTQLDLKDMGTVTWFYEYELVLVLKIKRAVEVFHDADVEHRCSHLKRTPIRRLCYKLRTAEAKLCVCSVVAGDKYRGIVDGDAHSLFFFRKPKRSRGKARPKKCVVLISGSAHSVAIFRNSFS